MSEIEPFNFDGTVVRTVTDDRGEPWFYARDVCNVLGIKQVGKVLSALDEDEKTAVTNVASSSVGPRRDGGRPEALVSESGLYAIILRSRKPQAKTFRKWITSEVIPALRRTGTYTLAASAPAVITEPAVEWRQHSLVPASDADLDVLAAMVVALREDREAIRVLRADVDHAAAVGVEALETVERVQEELFGVRADVVDLHKEMRERSAWLTAHDWMQQERKPRHAGDRTTNLLSIRATPIAQQAGLKCRKVTRGEYSHNTWPSEVWLAAWTELCQQRGWAV